MRTWVKGCLVAVLLAAVALGVLAVALGPRMVREGRRFAMPVISMVGEARQFETFVESHPFPIPATEAVTSEQLERFLAVRRRLDALYTRLAPELAKLPQGDAQSYDEAVQAMQVMGDLVPQQMRAFIDSEMAPKEYRYLDSIVYGKWKRGLESAGSHPSARELAISELEAAAAAEPDPAAAARLRDRAAALRAQPAPPPPGVSQEIHDLLVSRIEEIDRYSLEAFRHLAVPTF